MPTRRRGPLRLHLESRRAQHPSFHLDEGAWALAAARHPALAAQLQPSFGWDGEVLDAALADADFLIASRFDKRAVGAAPRIRWIHTTGAGVDHLLPLDDLPAAIVLTNSSGIHADKAGEYARMGLLMLNARMPEIVANQRAHAWESLLTAPIRGKTMVVVGFGDIGQAVARAAISLGLRVTAVSRSGRPSQALPDARVVTTEALDSVLPGADFVAVTAPLTPQTHHLMNAERLAAMRPTAGLINMARAALVDHDALVAQLRGGRFAGAILDVFDAEPLPASALFWDVPRLIVTPHVSCDAPDYNQRVLDIWFDNFERMQSGQPLRNRVDPARGY